jgi:hypothetical protein
MTAGDASAFIVCDGRCTRNRSVCPLENEFGEGRAESRDPSNDNSNLPCRHEAKAHAGNLRIISGRDIRSVLRRPSGPKLCKCIEYVLVTDLPSGQTSLR